MYWSCLQLSKHYGDKEDAVCEVEASITTGPLDKSRSRWQGWRKGESTQISNKCGPGSDPGVDTI